MSLALAALEVMDKEPPLWFIFLAAFTAGTVGKLVVSITNVNNAVAALKAARRLNLKSKEQILTDHRTPQRFTRALTDGGTQQEGLPTSEAFEDYCGLLGAD
jgi:hypothetical protein